MEEKRTSVFENGLGYIEGDSGHSYPNRYIWTQCLLKMAEWTGLFMKVLPAGHITNFPAKVNPCANSQATEQALNLNTMNFESSLFYLS